MARLSLILFVCCLFIGEYVNSRLITSEATRMPADDSMHDDDLMVMLSESRNNKDGDTPLQMQNLDDVTEEKKCAGVGEFVSTFVFGYH